MNERKDSDHHIAVRNFDGTIDVVEADEIRVCAPTKKCVKFWAQIIACFLSMGLGVFFMVFRGPEGVYFAIGEALLALSVGVLIPSPDYESMTKKRSHSEDFRRPERTFSMPTEIGREHNIV